MAKFPEIEIQGTRYQLRFTFENLCVVEERTGMALGHLLGSERLSTAKWLLWAGLRWKLKTLTPEAAAKLIQAAPGASFQERIRYVMEPIGEILQKEFPAPEEADESEEVAAEKKS